MPSHVPALQLPGHPAAQAQITAPASRPSADIPEPSAFLQSLSTSTLASQASQSSQGSRAFAGAKPRDVARTDARATVQTGASVGGNDQAIVAAQAFASASTSLASLPYSRSYGEGLGAAGGETVAVTTAVPALTSPFPSPQSASATAGHAPMAQNRASEPAIRGSGLASSQVPPPLTSPQQQRPKQLQQLQPQDLPRPERSQVNVASHSHQIADVVCLMSCGLPSADAICVQRRWKGFGSSYCH